MLAFKIFMSVLFTVLWIAFAYKGIHTIVSNHTTKYNIDMFWVFMGLIAAPLFAYFAGVCLMSIML